MSDCITLLDGIAFGEAPRWHNGRLYFSDMHRGLVLALNADGTTEVICTVANQPSGLGWDPAGNLMVVSMKDRRLLRQDTNGSLVELADLSALASWHCNDMVVDRLGRAYVGNFGFDLDGGAEPCLTNLIMVDTDGSTTEVANELGFPNGCVITPDGNTLIVGESWKGRLTAFDVAANGTLSNRRVWAKLDGAVPDGICLDAEGAIWSACPLSGRVLRVREGGEVLQVVDTGRPAFACMLGGDQGTTLFVCTADSSHPDETVVALSAKIEAIEVTVPRDGLQ